MCGFTAIVGPQAGRFTDTLHAMTGSLQHRGPDNLGVYMDDGIAMGHTRLSIQDLSNAANQPMHSPSGRYTIAFNGEIYNFLELRKELQGSRAFSTTSDTEVLLAAYEKWGTRALSHLRGMFAVVIWDHQTRQLFVARDRFGIKPLYWAKHKGHIYLASEIKALLAAGIPAAPNMHTVSQYLIRGLYDHTGDTFFDGIHQLPAAHTMVIDASSPDGVARKYYDLTESTEEPLELSFEDARNAFLEKLEETIRQHMISDVNIGCSVSGGIDSSALIALAGKYAGQGNAVQAYSVDYSDDRYSEKPWVESLMEHIGESCQYTMIDHDKAADAVLPMLDAQDEPYGGVPTAAWMYFFDACRRDKTTIILDGNGIDDYLAGYFPEVAAYMSALFYKSGFNDFRTEAEHILEKWGRDLWSLMAAMHAAQTPDLPSMAVDGSSPIIPSIVRESVASLTPPRTEEPSLCHDRIVRKRSIQRIEHTKIPRSLRFIDRASMMFSTEVRVPFLDHELIELSMRLPESHLVKEGNGKHIMRAALKGIVPEYVRTAPKRSVQTPQREWFQSGPLSGMLEQTLTKPSAFLSELIDAEKARDIFQTCKTTGIENSHPLWQWLVLDLWYKAKISPS